MSGRIRQYGENVRRRLDRSRHHSNVSLSRTYFDPILVPNYETSVYSFLDCYPGNDDFVINKEMMNVITRRLQAFFYLIKTVVHLSEIPPIARPEFRPMNNSLSGLLAHWSTLYGPNSNNQQKMGHSVASPLMYTYINSCLTHIKHHIRRIPEGYSNYELLTTLAKIKIGNLFKLLNNAFVDLASQHQILTLFCKTQKVYNGFTKFARLWRERKMPIQVDCDMGLNTIDTMKVPAITVYQNGAGYIFKISDLINIFNSALINSPHFFAEPLFPKNPYTNLPFSRATLYNAYYAIKQSDFNMPLLFQLFYEADFHIQTFLYNNEAIIRDLFIQDFVKSSTTDVLYLYVKQMFRSIDKRRRLKIDYGFPHDVLVDIMRPYLQLYLLHLFSISHSDRKFNANLKLQRKFDRFIRFNPQFGRKILVPIRPWFMQFPRSINDPYPTNPFIIPVASPLLGQMFQYQRDIHNVDGFGIELPRSNHCQYFSEDEFLDNPENKRLRYKITYNTEHVSYYSEEFVQTTFSYESNEDNGLNSDTDSGTETD